MLYHVDDDCGRGMEAGRYAIKGRKGKRKAVAHTERLESSKLLFGFFRVLGRTKRGKKAVKMERLLVKIENWSISQENS